MLESPHDFTVAAVTMVKDEADIIIHTCRHLREEGVGTFLIADNLSGDGTAEALQAFHDECMPPGDPRDWYPLVSIVGDPDKAYYQSRKMTNLFNLVQYGPFADQIRWVIPFDADELWYVEDGRTVAEYLATIPDNIAVVEARLHNYFGTSADPPGIAFERIQNRDPLPAPLPKVIVRAAADVTIHQGNHSATSDRPLGVLRAEESKLRIAHFPWRSYEQFERKVRNGAAAYAATDLPEAQGEHWRNYGAIFDQGGEAALRSVFNQWFFDPPMRLEHRPAPWRSGATA